MTARWTLTALGLAAVVVLVVAFLRWSPQVPDDAAASPVARTVMIGDVAPDPAEGTDPSEISVSPAGGECLPRIERTDGWFDVCWQARRSPYDGDPAKDYYLLRVYGTFGSGIGGNPRWAMLKGDLVGVPADSVLEGWPSGEFDGPCQPEPVPGLLAEPPTQDTLCGHIHGYDLGTWAHAVTWTCVGCLLPGDRDGSLSLYIAVGVPEGTVPEWDLYADVGG